MTMAKLKINLNAIKRNWKALNKLSDNFTETAAVVKANAYGLGIGKVAPVLWEAGARKFFVSTMEEGVELRSFVPIGAQIFCLNGYNLNDKEVIRNFNIVPIINNFDQLGKFLASQTNEPMGINIDIGMNRLGFKENQIEKLIGLINKLNITIIIGHFSSADNFEAPETHEQYKIFSRATLFFPNAIQSLSATGGIMHGKKYHLNLTRPGIGLYGGLPFKDAENVVTLEVPIIQIKEIASGEAVGYNYTYVAPKKKIDSHSCRRLC
jgi:alanine racemase